MEKSCEHLLRDFGFGKTSSTGLKTSEEHLDKNEVSRDSYSEEDLKFQIWTKIGKNWATNEN